MTNNKKSILKSHVNVSTGIYELDGVIEDFKKETDDRYTVDVSIDLSKGSLDLTRVRKPYLKLVKK